jgi:hypothetical protein
LERNIIEMALEPFFGFPFGLIKAEWDAGPVPVPHLGKKSDEENRNNILL